MSPEDFQLGYSMTGHLERSESKYVNFSTTHMAFVRRKQANQAPGKSKGSGLPLPSVLTANESVYPERIPSPMADVQDSSLRSTDTTSNSSASTFVGDDMAKDHEVLLVVADHQDLPSSSERVATLNNQACCPVQCLETVSAISKTCFSKSESGQAIGKQALENIMTLDHADSQVCQKIVQGAPIILPADLQGQRVDSLAPPSLGATAKSSSKASVAVKKMCKRLNFTAN